MTAKFEAGRTYRTRSIVNSDFWVTIKVINRTAKTIRVVTQTRSEPKNLRITALPGSFDGAETVKPWGSYSMCPIIIATDR